MNVQEWAKAAKQEWESAVETAKAGGDGFSKVGDGTYFARLNEIKFHETQGGRECVQLVWVILNGPEEGSFSYQLQFLDQERSTEFLARILYRFGVELPKNPAKLEKIFEKMTEEKTVCRIKLQTGQSGYQNTYIQQNLGPDYEVSASEDEDEDEDTVEETDDESEEEESEADESEDESEDEDESEEETEDEEESEEESSDDGEEEESESNVGRKVEYTFNGKTCTGVVLEENDENDTLIVRDDESGKKRSVTPEKNNVLLLDEDEAEESDEEEEEEEEETPAPPKKPTGKKK